MISVTYISILIAVPIVTLGMYLITKGIANLKQLLHIAENRITKIADLCTGVAEVCGQVLTGPQVKSPFQLIECVAYSYTVERFMLRTHSNLAVSGGLSSQQVEDYELQHQGEPAASHWAVVAEKSSDTLFIIDDTSGQIAVEPSGCKMNFKRQFEYESDAPDGKRFLPTPILSVVEHESISMNASMRFREWVILPGEYVFVSGVARERTKVVGANGDKQLCGTNNLKYEIGGSDSTELIITNLNRKDLKRFLARTGWQRIIAGIALCSAAIGCLAYLIFHFAGIQ